MKTCTCCEVPKPLDEFKIACDRSSGYHSICKACAAMKQRNIRPVHGTPEYVQMLTASREHYAINKVKIRARRKARRLELKHMAWVQAQRSQALADVIVPDDAVNEFPVKVIEVVAPIPGGLFEAPVRVDMSAQLKKDMAKFDEIPDEDMDLGTKRLAEAIKASTTKGDK